MNSTRLVVTVKMLATLLSALFGQVCLAQNQVSLATKLNSYSLDHFNVTSSPSYLNTFYNPGNTSQRFNVCKTNPIQADGGTGPQCEQAGGAAEPCWVTIKSTYANLCVTRYSSSEARLVTCNSSDMNQKWRVFKAWSGSNDYRFEHYTAIGWSLVEDGCLTATNSGVPPYLVGVSSCGTASSQRWTPFNWTQGTNYLYCN